MHAVPRFHARGDGRPPVEHRLGGLDRRTIVPAVVALAVIALWVLVVPAINESLSYKDQVRAADVFRVGPGATIAPPAGWGVQDGLRTTDRSRIGSDDNATTRFVSGSLLMATQAGEWTKSPRELAEKTSDDSALLGKDAGVKVVGEPVTFTTASGQHGAARRFQAVGGAGAIFAFVENGTGIEIVVSGTEADLERNTQEIGRAIASINLSETSR